jgi:beta-glucosidase
VKFALGLFENPYTDESRKNQGPLTAENLEVARVAAQRSLVLLKNDSVEGHNVLPLGQAVTTVALIGPLGDDATNMLGSWAGRGNPADAVTLKTALAQRLGAANVKYAKGAEIREATNEQIDEAVAAANAADVAILALGEDANSMTAEAGSRAHLNLPGRQEELLEKVSATGKPVVLILFSGRPLILHWAFDHVPAVLAAWFPGVQAGPALVKTLFGETPPTGKLVVSWPHAIGQIPLYYNALNTGRPAPKSALTSLPAKGENKYSSRYVDEQNGPQFPFGYGLTYTQFSYTNPQVGAAHLSARTLNDELRKPNGTGKHVLTVTANVTNTGNVAAEEVVELYFGLRGTSVEEPVRALKAFQRVSLAAGETKKVSFELGAEAFALWDINDEWKVEPSKVNLWVSPDSATGEAVEIEIGE